MADFHMIIRHPAGLQGINGHGQDLQIRPQSLSPDKLHAALVDFRPGAGVDVVGTEHRLIIV